MWSTCATCGLKYQPKGDGGCPRCAARRGQAIAVAPAQVAPVEFETNPYRGFRPAAVLLVVNAIANLFTAVMLLKIRSYDAHIELPPNFAGFAASGAIDVVCAVMLWQWSERGRQLTIARIGLGLIFLTAMAVSRGEFATGAFQVALSSGILMLLIGSPGRRRVAAGAILSAATIAVSVVGPLVQGTIREREWRESYYGHRKPKPEPIAEPEEPESGSAMAEPGPDVNAPAADTAEQAPVAATPPADEAAAPTLPLALSQALVTVGTGETGVVVAYGAHQHRRGAYVLAADPGTGVAEVDVVPMGWNRRNPFKAEVVLRDQAAGLALLHFACDSPPVPLRFVVTGELQSGVPLTFVAWSAEDGRAVVVGKTETAGVPSSGLRKIEPAHLDARWGVALVLNDAQWPVGLVPTGRTLRATSFVTSEALQELVARNQTGAALTLSTP